MRSALALVTIAGCGGSPQSTVDAQAADTGGSDAALSLDPTPGTYRGTCDGSGGVALDFDHFLDVNDEDQVARIYRRAADGPPVQQLSIAAALGIAAADEADLEGATRIGDRLYVTTSHGRKTSGELDRARYRAAAFDIAGAAPAISLTPAGRTTELLDQMLVTANWDAPAGDVISALVASSKLGDGNAADLAPELAGTNIEAITGDGDGRLLFGFRNPRPAGRAIVVSLVNPDTAFTGGTARFGGAATLDLGGLGIRDLAFSPVHRAVLIVAGAPAGGGPFRLYRWTGAVADPAVFIRDLAAPADGAPEAIVAYPGTHDVQIVYDQGDADINGVPCKDAAAADRVFSDAIVTVDPS